MHVHVLGICGYATFGAAILALARGDSSHRLGRSRVSADE